MTDTFTFTPTSATMCGTVYQAQYSISPDGHVTMALTDDTDTIQIILTPDDAFYSDALRAAQTALNIKPQATKPTVTHTAAPVDKPWIGTTIKGKG